jgi:cell division GTPase FtsZ
MLYRVKRDNKAKGFEGGDGLKMKDKVGFVGIGQAGGNIVNLFEKHGYSTFFVNSSQEDLNTIMGKSKYHIQGADGCNHDRNKAKEFAKKSYKAVIQNIGAVFANHEIIYLVFSGGGGTGSGLSPLMVDMLSKVYPDKKFGAVVILPDSKESIKAQTNAYACLSELSKIDSIGSVFVLDNDKGDRFSINESFVTLFNEMMEMVNYISPRGNIDAAEIKELLSVRGCSIITTSSGDGLIYANIVQSIQNNIFADMEKDKKIVYMGLSLADEIDINNITNHTGVPYDTFINYNDLGINITVLSGLSFPETRIEAIKSIIETHRNTIKSSVENSKKNSISSVLDWDIEVTSKKVDVLQQEVNFEDIFKKY